MLNNLLKQNLIYLPRNKLYKRQCTNWTDDWWVETENKMDLGHALHQSRAASVFLQKTPDFRWVRDWRET